MQRQGISNAIAGKRILVLPGQALGNIGAIRSLGRAGCMVFVASSQSRALGFYSRFVFKTTVAPEFSSAGFISWFSRYVSYNNIELVMPCEPLILALLPDWDAFKHLFAVPYAQALLARAFSKAQTIQHFIDSGVSDNLPESKVISSIEALMSDTELTCFRYPCFVKVDEVDLIQEGAPTAYSSAVRKCQTYADVISVVRAFLQTHRHVLIQAFAPGKGAGVNVLIWQGKVITTLANVCDRESPYTGGLGAIRSVIEHPEMEADALAKLQAMDWQGVAMVEYRLDQTTGQFFFMEVNARIWAAMHLALFAGADFPRYLAECHFGATPDIPNQYTSVRCRWDYPADLGHVVSVLKSNEFSAWQKLCSFLSFFYLYLDPTLHHDLIFPGDSKLFLRQKWEIIRSGRLGKLYFQGVKLLHKLLKQPALSWIFQRHELAVYRLELDKEKACFQRTSHVKLLSEDELQLLEAWEDWQDVEELRRDFQHRMSEGELMFGVVENQKILAFAWLIPQAKASLFPLVRRHFHYPEGSAVIYNVYTSPMARGRGLYRAVLHACITYAVNKLNLKYIYQAIEPTNKIPIMMADKIGFQEQKRFKYLCLLGGQTVKES
ncbi:GNAT family N-acetyltransferase [Endozoicomonas sp. SM1973]|uniref:GNAT family N-acetyltransferase n=1 Tax=Spartinivicinus marinus TaxID=2994442 RepID=A0A853I8J9_9GAMM|nr:GNAT family N-acetyltransferase [Spartinivicinus marinus]MCX4028113.1 GNAT family N-acetyltransferase [Spartinivicinus marinus]NYZ66211.1 GNAT family N-acetyltransferase [Spartinivicinus marinus]